MKNEITTQDIVADSDGGLDLPAFREALDEICSGIISLKVLCASTPLGEAAGIAERVVLDLIFHIDKPDERTLSAN